MTKLRTPMTTDRVSAALAKAIATLFPPALAPGMPATPDTARRDEYVEIFTEAAEDILRVIDDAVNDAVIDKALEVAKKYTEVDVDSLRNGKRALRKEHVINQLLVACLASQQHTSATYEATERLRNELKETRALPGRMGKAGPSKSVGDIVSHYATCIWAAKPWMRKTAHGTAAEIAFMMRMNTDDLRKDDLKKLGAKNGQLSVSAITKRVRRILRKSP
jgi:CheY-like chemotaxis protein